MADKPNPGPGEAGRTGKKLVLPVVVEVVNEVSALPDGSGILTLRSVQNVHRKVHWSLTMRLSFLGE